jgi:WD40 repeat protein
MGTHDVTFTPDGKFLAMACENTRNNNPYRVGVWETATGRQLAAFDTPAWHIETALSPDSSLLVVNPFGRHLTVFSVKDKRPTRNLEWAVNPLERTDLSGDIDFSPDGKYFGITLDNGRFFLFDVSRWE